MQISRKIAGALAIASALALSACSGSNGSGSPIVQPTSPSGLPGSVAFTSAIGDGTVQIPLAYPGSGGTVTVTTSLTPPAGVPATASKEHRTASALAHTALLYIGVTFSQATQLTGQLSFVIDPPVGYDPNAGSLYVAFYEVGGWNYGFEGPGAETGGKIVFTPAPGDATFTGGVQYVYAIYQLSGATPTPAPTPTSTPSPTPTPTPPPAGVLSINPLNVNVYGIGSSNAATIIVQETGYSGTFTESDTCNPSGGQIATIAASSAAGASATYVATGISAGSCTATFSDSTNQHITIPVVVTTNGFIIQSHRH